MKPNNELRSFHCIQPQSLRELQQQSCNKGRLKDHSNMSQPSSTASPGSPGWNRLNLLFSQSGAAHEQAGIARQQLRGWATDTMLAAGTGAAMAALYQWVGKAGADAPKSEAAARLQTAKELARVRSAALKGGLRLGGLAAVYYGVGMLTAVYHNQYNVVSHTAGATSAASLLGLSLAGFRGAALGAAVGAAVGVPTGLLWDRAGDWLPGERPETTAEIFPSARQELQKTGADGRSSPAPAAVLAQLEASLSSRQRLQQQQQQQQPAGQQAVQQQ